MNATDIESQVLEQIAPTKQQQQQIIKAATAFIKKLQSNLKDAEVILGGSVAKDTYLSNKTDVDVFVRFNYENNKHQSHRLSNILAAALKKSFPKTKIEKVHGSRDYFQLQKDNFDFEIVPILLISRASASINITDISPLHSIWINKQEKSVKNQIRLTKQFARANGTYGAESFIAGFSGYLLEILTIHYGSFQKLLEASTKWKNKQVVDVENYHKGKDIFMEIDIAKLNSPLIVVDPVDKYRNVAAALSEEKFKRFKKAAKQYLKSANFSFFENQPISLESTTKIAKSKKRNLIYLEIKAKTGKRDVIGCKLLKAFEHIKAKLSGFDIKQSDWWWQPGLSAKFYILTAKNQLPKEMIKQGPPVKMTEAAKNFKLKNKAYQIQEKKGTLYAAVPIRTRNLELVTQKILKDKYITEKINKVAVLEIIPK